MVSIILLICTDRKRIISLAFGIGVAVIVGIAFYFGILKNENVMLEDDDGIPGVMISGKRYAFFHKPAIVINETLVHNLGCIVAYEKSKFRVFSKLINQQLTQKYVFEESDAVILP